VKILKINTLDPSQVLEIVELDRVCFGSLWTAEGYLREIDSPNSCLISLHILHIDNGEDEISDGRLIGLACLWAIMEEAHITLLGVHPDYRRQGFGRLLLLTLFKDALLRKLERATLEVNINNLQAINLYQKYGFQIAGKRKGYYQKTGEDALILWRKGLNQPEFELNLSQWRQNIDDRLNRHSYQVS
jgi:[ribosomal protein S18]-alanine N-acetyltransferase